MVNRQLPTLLLIFVLILSIIPATASATQETVTTNVDTGITILTKLGDLYEIMLPLPVTAGTGYSWKLDLSDGLELMSTNTYSKSHRMDGLEIQEFKIKAASTGLQNIKGVSKKFLEPETGNEETFSLNIDVI